MTSTPAGSYRDGVTSSLRWGTEGPKATPADARRRLVEAAQRCFERLGVAKTTIEDVAREANVSRATVYRYFADRGELVLAVLATELDRHSRATADQVRTSRDPVEAIVEGALRTVDAFRTNPRLQLFGAGDAAGFTLMAVGASKTFFAVAAQHIAPQLRRGQEAGVIRRDFEADEGAEWLTRVAISMLSVEGLRERSREEMRAYLRTFLVPALVPDAVAGRS